MSEFDYCNARELATRLIEQWKRENFIAIYFRNGTPVPCLEIEDGETLYWLDSPDTRQRLTDYHLANPPRINLEYGITPAVRKLHTGA